MSAPELLSPDPPHRRPVGPPEAPRHLRLVGEEELAAIRRHRRLRIGVAVLAAFVIALLSAAVGMHVVLAQNQVRLDTLTAQANATQSEYQQLRLQVDQLSSPARILAIAQGQLHMAAPATVTYVHPASATSAGGGPAAATGPAVASTPSGPPPATPPPDWATVKPHLAASA